ncbi:MAG: cytochrome C, partial [Pseudomonadota bacterium]
MRLRRLLGGLLAAALGLALGSGAMASGQGYLCLEGHGGPIKGLAVSPDGGLALSASFDNALGLWSLPDGRHLGWLEGHAAAANAAIFLPEGRALSAGDDFALILWDLETRTALHRLEGHRGKIIALALSPDGTMAASAGWDGRIGLWSLDDPTAPPRWLEGHQANVNDVAFAEGGRILYSAGYDGTLRRWDLEDTSHTPYATVVGHGFGLNHIVLDEAAG